MVIPGSDTGSLANTLALQINRFSMILNGYYTEKWGHITMGIHNINDGIDPSLFFLLCTTVDENALKRATLGIWEQKTVKILGRWAGKKKW